MTEISSSWYCCELHRSKWVCWPKDSFLTIEYSRKNDTWMIRSLVNKYLLTKERNDGWYRYLKFQINSIFQKKSHLSKDCFLKSQDRIYFDLWRTDSARGGTCGATVNTACVEYNQAPDTFLGLEKGLVCLLLVPIALLVSRLER